mgnify:CR=1 FL=1
MKSISTLALIAATGIFATAASAADLGGNCCADLEERIAELEATTARKGNRKVSLTVSGHINENIMFWDDGSERNVYAGQTNMAAQTRFRFVGNAKISEDLSAGYLLEIGTASSRSDHVDQNTDDFGGGLGIRHSAWWMQSKHLGKVWVGQTSTATDGITEINLANTAHIGMQNLAANGGAMFVRNANGTSSGLRHTQFMGGAAGPSSAAVDSSQIGEGNRQNVVKYESPSLMGFSLATAYGEDDMWDIAMRYAGEHHGFKLAFGVGYQRWTDGNNDERNCAPAIAGSSSDRDCQQLGLSGAVMHVATGLYVHGVYGIRWDDNAPVAQKDTTDRYYLQAGIENKFIALGKTTLFGEYGNYNVGFNGNGTNLLTAHTQVWGIGLNQSIEAAAMDLYLNYQHFDFGGTSNLAGFGAGGGLKDYQQVIAGGIIRF